MEQYVNLSKALVEVVLASNRLLVAFVVVPVTTVPSLNIRRGAYVGRDFYRRTNRMVFHEDTVAIGTTMRVASLF